ncbi:MAG: Rid family hydrolase [Acidobacteria bacterium]|nr:Rid family hydrolase [Acidobacteriota bacterium]MDA1234216.1 Rid family hydrolase [Acidobacteriota bacterium]
MRANKLALVLALCAACSPTPPTSETTVANEPGSGQFAKVAAAGQTVYLSGQTADGSGDIESRTRGAMDKLGAVLDEQGLEFSNLVNCRLQLADMDDYQTVNGIYASYFESERYPARTTVQVAALPDDGRITVTCIAYQDAASMSIVRPSPEVIPPAMGPYSPAVMAGDMLYVSGQGGRDPLTGETSPEAGAQTDRTLQTIQATIAAQQLGLDSIVTAAFYYPDLEDTAQIEARLSAAMPAGSGAARSAVPVGRLPGDIAVEIAVIAAKDKYTVTRLYPAGEEASAGLSPAVLAGNTLYVTALAMPEAGVGLEEQFQAILTRQKLVLGLAEMDLSNVVYADVYLTDVADTEAVRGLIGEAFGAKAPAGTIVGMNSENGAKVMVGLVAAK